MKAKIAYAITTKEDKTMSEKAKSIHNTETRKMHGIKTLSKAMLAQQLASLF